MADEPLPHRVLGKLLLIAALVALTTAMAPDQLRSVVFAMACGIAIAGAFFVILFNRSRTAPIAEIGTMFVAAVTIYLVVPLVVYLVLGGRYTLLNDNRLFLLQPSPTEMASVAWLYLAFLGPFAATYLLVRGRAEPPREGVGAVTKQLLAIMIVLYLLFSLLSFMIVAPLHSDSYAGGYAAVAALPLAMRQFMKLWEGWSILLALGVRVWLFQDFQRRKWLIAGWLAYDVAMVAIALGSRTALAISLVSSAMLYHLLVRPIPVRTALAAGGLGLIAFLALGVIRAYRGFGAAGQWTSGNAGGEFEVLFANIVDLRARLASGELGSLPIGFHLADILSPFPSQILPLQKYDPADWYVHTFYPEAADRGVGMAFGVIAQGVVGLGWIELVLRGMILGWVFAAFHRYFSTNAHRFWVVVAYVWLTVWCYQSFRNQSFILLSFVMQWFLPLVLVVEGGRRLLSGPRASFAGSVPRPPTAKLPTAPAG